MARPVSGAGFPARGRRIDNSGGGGRFGRARACPAPCTAPTAGGLETQIMQVPGRRRFTSPHPPQPPSRRLFEPLVLRQTAGGDGRRGENGSTSTVPDAGMAKCGPSVLMHNVSVQPAKPAFQAGLGLRTRFGPAIGRSPPGATHKYGCTTCEAPPQTDEHGAEVAPGAATRPDSAIPPCGTFTNGVIATPELGSSVQKSVHIGV